MPEELRVSLWLTGVRPRRVAPSQGCPSIRLQMRNGAWAKDDDGRVQRTIVQGEALGWRPRHPGNNLNRIDEFVMVN